MRVALSYARNRTATGVDRYAAELAPALGRAGVVVREIPLERREARLGPVRFGGFASIWVQRLRAKWGGSEILHALDPAAAPRYADVVTIHDLLAEQFSHLFLATRRARFDWMLTRSIARTARFFVTPSEATRREVIMRWDIAPERILVAHHGIDQARFRPVEGISPPPGPPTIVYVGDDNPRKDVGTAVRAVALLREQHGVTARLVRVGPSRFPSVHEAYRLEAKKRGVQLVEPGYVPDEEVARLLTGAAAFIWPTRGEGFGFPPLEAMACGAPVVASDILVNREVCGPLARYHGIGDAEGCAEALAATLGSPPPRERLVEHARTFTWEATAQRHIAVYERALQERAG